MANRLRTLGVVLALAGLGFVVAGFVAYLRVQDGYDSMQAFSEAQDVTLSYDENGNLLDRGTTEGADAIMTLLTEDWAYPVDMGDLDPNDPLVNTASEYMYQMATVGYHVLNGTTTVVLEEDVEFEGETFAAGTYDVATEGRYWTGFNREHPLEGPAREAAWTGTAHGLIGELGVGTLTHSALQMGLALAGILAAIGLLAAAIGLGLVWTSRAKEADPFATLTIPDRIPADMTTV